jgi:hypothetical protein
MLAIRLDAMHRMRPAVRRPLLPSAATGRPYEAAVARTSGRARARGKPASPTRLSYERGSQAAGQFAANVLPIIRDIQAAGHTSLNAIAGQLNARKVATANGGQGDLDSAGGQRSRLAVEFGGWVWPPFFSQAWYCLGAIYTIGAGDA